jgi:2-polyprenyl-6-methoxyphenol hydroxylase-like FAD-dependent oxidoreductase
MTVLIAGGGIAGLALGLTLHQIGVPFRIYEATRQIRPLGVGINVQPNAVRELFDLGLQPALDNIAVKTQQYGFYSKHGRKIWEEPRGLLAGYDWPQYSVHRGRLQMLLYDTLIARAGPACFVTGQRAKGFETQGTQAVLHLEDSETGARSDMAGDILIGADGIHSAIRNRIVPQEGPPIWGGAILWRATSQAKPFFGQGAMALIGHDTKRIVAYPISRPDPASGLVTMNWIAELRVDPGGGWNKEDWNRAADISDFLPEFEDWVFDWLDVPALIRGADAVFEYPMVDRDPLETWTNGPVTLMGDAAHPTYPVGSNGATQAIVDARVLGAAFLEHGVTPRALHSYEDQMRPLTTGVIRANRGSGPDAILQRVEDLCGGHFDDINDVIPHADLAEHAARYKAVAGFSIDALNAQPGLIPTGAKLIYS